jgi:hypothetical protein
LRARIYRDEVAARGDLNVSALHRRPVRGRFLALFAGVRRRVVVERLTVDTLRVLGQVVAHRRSLHKALWAAFPRAAALRMVLMRTRNLEIR